jgi:hypothetical protein
MGGGAGGHAGAERDAASAGIYVPERHHRDSDQGGDRRSSMRPTSAFLPRLAPLARFGVAAVVGTVLVGMPMSDARAEDDGSTTLADDSAPLMALAEQLATTRRDTEQRLRGLVHDAFARTVERVHEARRGMEAVVTFGYGIEGLASLDASAFAEEDDATTEPERPRRLEYAEGANDPLAGL